MKDKFYTVKQLAEILQINERTVTSLIKRGVIGAVNVGTEKKSHWRIYEGQYLNFIATGYKETNEELN